MLGHLMIFNVHLINLSQIIYSFNAWPDICVHAVSLYTDRILTLQATSVAAKHIWPGRVLQPIYHSLIAVPFLLD